MTVFHPLQQLFVAEGEAMTPHLAISAAMTVVELAVGERSLIDPDTPRRLLRFAETEAPVYRSSLNLRARADALPFARESVDRFLLPHYFDRDFAHTTGLERIAELLVHDGLLVITGINPLNVPARYLARAWRKSANESGSRPLPPAEAMRRLASAGFVAMHQAWLPHSVLGARWFAEQGQRRMINAGDRWWPALAPGYLLVLHYRPRKALRIHSSAPIRSRFGLAAPIEPTQRRPNDLSQ
ncbi:hypothetical protein OAS86_02605 [Gammaproteobacteria bacterium]|nr:hypothetical protein [Gammaproteobacteria bacterium]